MHQAKRILRVGISKLRCFIEPRQSHRPILRDPVSRVVQRAEIELANVDEALGIVAEALEIAGAPQGSELIQTSDDRVLREFGKLQCLATYLDGTSLPDEVYASLDEREVWSQKEANPPAIRDSYVNDWLKDVEQEPNSKSQGNLKSQIRNHTGRN